MRGLYSGVNRSDQQQSHVEAGSSAGGTGGVRSAGQQVPSE